MKTFFRSILVLLTIILVSQHMNAQSLKDYQWKNRLVVVFTDTISNPSYREQLEIMKKETPQFEERKLQLILAVPGKYREIFPSTSGWVPDPELYKYRKMASEDFEVLLIGLDGGVKLRQASPFTTKRLFSTIDSMPMRQAEIRKQGRR